MTSEANEISTRRVEVVKAQGEEPVFKAGDAVTISVRFLIGHFVCRTTFAASAAGSSPSSSLPPSTMKRKATAAMPEANGTTTGLPFH